MNSILRYTSLSLVLLAAMLSCPARAAACPDVDGLVDLNCDGLVAILTFGDSITVGDEDELGLGYPGRLQQIFPHTFVVNLGRGGENTSSGRRRAATTFERYAGDYTIILEGVNNYFDSSPSVSSTRSNLLSIAASSDATGALTLLATLTDVERSRGQHAWVQSVNRAIAPYASIDFSSLGSGILAGDRLHPNGAGYQQMAEMASTILLSVSETHRPVDRDSDGLYDWEEARYGSSRTNADTDRDGLSDGDEVWLYHSSPVLTDTDGDGFSDAYEVSVLHSDPSNPNPGTPTLEMLQIIP